MKKITKYIVLYLMTIGLAVVSSCDIDEIRDPNNLSVSGDPSKQELNLLATGTESLLRTEVGFYYDVIAIIGREMYFFTNSDPRFTGEILGKGGSQLDPAGFYGTRPYAADFKVVKNANLLLEGIDNTSEVLTSQEQNAYSGFAKTAQAYSMLLALNLQYQNGIRVDVSDVDNLGDFQTFDASLVAIASLLDAANTELGSAGSEFPFILSAGFEDFDTPSDFAEFNRAIAARVALYQGNNSTALSMLSSSFMDMNGDLDDGPEHFYSTSGVDISNPVFRTPDQSEALVAHPSYITDIRSGDDRDEKVTLRTTTALLDGLSSDYDVTIFSSLASPIPIIRNEELILINAEANIGTDNAAAISALDVIRNEHGLGDYSGATDDASVMAELIYNRRYSLFGDGHRWIDMRRWGLLNQLPLDRPGDQVWDQLPRPVSETN